MATEKQELTAGLLHQKHSLKQIDAKGTKKATV